MNIIGVDIGGTKCALSVPDGEARVKEVARFATTDVAGTRAQIYAEIARLDPPRDTVFGVSCGGPLDAKRGLILSPPNLPGWDRIAICDELTQRFGAATADRIIELQKVQNQQSQFTASQAQQAGQFGRVGRAELHQPAGAVGILAEGLQRGR